MALKEGRKQIHAKVQLDDDVYTLAVRRAGHVLDTFDKVMIGFSGGKDSTATLNVTLAAIAEDPRRERHLPLRCVFWDEEAIPYETEEYVRRIAQRDDIDLTWFCIPVRHRNACSRQHPWWWPWAPEAEDKWCRPLPAEAVREWPGFPLNPPKARLTIPEHQALLVQPEDGNVALLMGIRAAESLIRARAVMRHPIDNYIIPYLTGEKHSVKNLWKAYPVYDWTTKDVWTAPRLLGWDYNRAYDALEMAGVSHHAQRCSPAFGEEPLQKLHTYAQAFPDVWAKMAERVPGVGAAYRYARTELWAFGGLPDKPAGVAWPDFILRYVAQHDPKVQAGLRRRIHEVIYTHYRKTAGPILEDARHPESGVSWKWILMLAMRGDIKERRQPTMMQNMHDDGTRDLGGWAKYAAELAALCDQGVTRQYLGHPGGGPLPGPERVLPAYAMGVLAG